MVKKYNLFSIAKILDIDTIPKRKITTNLRYHKKKTAFLI